MGGNTLESMQQWRPNNLSVDAILFRPKILELRTAWGPLIVVFFVLSHGRTGLPNVLSLN